MTEGRPLVEEGHERVGASGDPEGRRGGSSRSNDGGHGSDHGPSGRVDYVDLKVSARRQPKSFGRLWSLLRQSIRLTWEADRRLFLLTVVLQLSGAAVLAAQVVVVQAVLDAILRLTDGTASATDVLVPIGLLALINALTAVTSAMQASEQRLLGDLVMRATWQQLLDVAGAVELRAFESSGFFDRLQRVQTNALSRPSQLTQGLVGIVGGLAGTVALVLAIISIEPLLVPLLLLAGVPMFFTSRQESRREFDFMVAQTPRLRMRQYLGQVLTGRDEAKEIRAFALATTLRARFDDIYGAYVSDLRRHVRARIRLALLGNTASALVLAMTLFALVWLIEDGQVDLAEAGAAIVAVRLLASQITTVMRSSQRVFESGLFLDDLNGFVAMRPSVDPAALGDPAPKGFDELTVEKVGFTYPGSQVPALRDVSLRMHSGEIIALVGENGSGKTTLAKLLAALYDPSSGAIRWDGQDITRFERAGLRDAVAVIFQDFVRYQLPAGENIGMGRSERMDDHTAVVDAARQAGAAEAIERLPHGYGTILSKLFREGQDLSGGQWQRVALARAFFRDAPFVILDEPTASLDPRAEHRLFQSLHQLLAGRTVLFISHRFSTVRNADRIYVLHEGRVIEQGDHDQLMQLDGHYAELFRLQAAAYLGPEGRA